MIKPTSSLSDQTRMIELNSDIELIVKFIDKRRTLVDQVENLKISKDNITLLEQS